MNVEKFEAVLVGTGLCVGIGISQFLSLPGAMTSLTWLLPAMAAALGACLICDHRDRQLSQHILRRCAYVRFTEL